MKTDLNGHHCQNTEEHYNKLREGMFKGRFRSEFKYIYIEFNWIEFSNVLDTSKTPMHLHNNEWVFGSLEYEYFDEASERMNDHQLANERFNEPKQVQRITREDVSVLILKACNLSEDTKLLNNEMDVLFDYIEQLEANQKE